MFGSQILEVAIGVIFVFILVSVICTAVREVIETFLKTRSAYLEQGIRELLHDNDDGGLTEALYNHPLIHSLFSGEYQRPQEKRPYAWLARGGDLPSYIPARNFALALMDIAVRGRTTDAVNAAGTTELTTESIRANLRKIGNPAVQRALLTALDEARGNLERTRLNVQDWFDSSMDRVAGHYKRASQKIILVIGLTTAVVLNVDAIRISQYLFRNDAARTVIAARAEAAVASGDTLLQRTDAREALNTLDDLHLPIGWANVRYTPARDLPSFARETPAWWGYWGVTLGAFVMALVGWAITGAAASLGAPFWFDLLNKVMVIRSTVKPHEKSPEEASEDRQIRGTDATVEVNTVGTGSRAGLMRDGAQQPEGAGPDFGDPEDLEGCGIHDDTATSDEDLPPAQGGVA
jgi:hypothetical protein